MFTQLHKSMPAKLRSRIFLCLLFGSMGAEAIAADAPNVRNNDEMGNFEVEWGHLCDDDCKLQERYYSSSWYVVAQGDGNQSQSIPNYIVTDKPAGTYSYRVQDRIYDYEERETILETSDIQELIVGPVSNPPTLEEQLNYDYETRVGDINFDGLKDIFLNRITTAPANNGTVKSVLLKQVTVGTFQAIVPNGPQTSAASSWPLAAMDVILADANLDGFADIRLKGVGSVITGVHDQLVYSPAVAYTDVARNVRAIDPNFEAFANDLISYYLDDDYFSDHATQVYEQGSWDVEYDCELDWQGILGWEWVCDLDYVWEPGGWVTEYPGVSASAVSVWEKAVSADSGQTSWENVLATLSRHLAVDIRIGPWCIGTWGGISDDCRNAGIGAVIVGLFDLFEHEDSPRMRVPNRIYITGHRIKFFDIAVGPRHVALEFQKLTELIPTTVSATTSDAPSLTGDLVAAENRPSDQWFNNITYGVVVSSNAGEFDHTYFERIRDASGFYDDHNCLPYQASPSLMPGEGYNSSGYISSLIDFTDGIATAFWGGWGPPVGWDTQIDFAWFTSSPPQCP